MEHASKECWYDFVLLDLRYKGICCKNLHVGGCLLFDKSERSLPVSVGKWTFVVV